MIDHVTIAVDDFKHMVPFYEEVLSVTFSKVRMYDRELFEAQFGLAEILMCPKDLAGVTAHENTIQLRFVIPDLEAAYLRGVENGGVPISEPSDGLASLRDPDGNSLILKQHGYNREEFRHSFPESMILEGGSGFSAVDNTAGIATIDVVMYALTSDQYIRLLSYLEDHLH